MQSINIQNNPIIAKQSEDGKHLHGFDYLRAAFSFLVVLAHSNFFGYFANQWDQAHGAGVNIWDILYFQLQASSVPSFVLMSMLLFALKRPNLALAWKRVGKLFYLYGFWVGAWILQSRLRPEPSIYGWLEFIIRGGGWVFYTFIVLMILTPMCCLAEKMRTKSEWFGPIISGLVVIGTFTYLHEGFKWTRQSYYWVPMCFAMAPFIAVWMVPRLEEIKCNKLLRIKYISAFVLISIICAIVEWQFRSPQELLPHWRAYLPKHARLSVQFMAVAVIIASLGVTQRVPNLIQFFARNSSGVYCLHPFVLSGIGGPVQKLVAVYAPSMAIFSGALTVVVVCSWISEFLRKAFRERLI